MNIRISIGLLALAAPLQMAAETRDEACVRRTFGPGAIARNVAGAGVKQAQTSPREWGGGMAGFGKRLASSFGNHLVKHAIQYPIARFRHEQLSFQRSPTPGFGPRLKHALLATVITSRTDREGNTVAAGHITGAIGAGFISRLWHPARLHTFASGISTGGLILATDAAGNVLREFWPEIRHPRRRKAVKTERPVNAPPQVP